MVRGTSPTSRQLLKLCNFPLRSFLASLELQGLELARAAYIAARSDGSLGHLILEKVEARLDNEVLLGVQLGVEDVLHLGACSHESTTHIHDFVVEFS